ncbi:hypothetical protein TNCV_4829251 [Trichonephila clavipes]|nr:hypothetical protein TNCV_4829251 [Trichonephila clavipes]
MCQLPTCDGHRPCIGLGLPPYTIITHSVKRRQSVEPVCAILSYGHGHKSVPVAVFRSSRGPTSVSWGKLPTRTTQPTSGIGTVTSTFTGLKEDTCSKDSLAADQR